MRVCYQLWRWIRSHWLDLMLPPAFFILAVTIYGQVQRVVHGKRSEQGMSHYQASVKAQKSGDQKTSLSELRKAVNATKDRPEIQISLAVSLHKLGRTAEAAEVVERALSRQKSPREADYVGLVRAWYDSERYDDAERVLRQELLRRWPDSIEAMFLDGLIQMERGKGEDALRKAADCFEQCLTRAPQHINARYQYAICLSRLGRPADAEPVFRKVLETAPIFNGAHHGLASALREQGKLVEAKTVLDELKRIEERQRKIRYLQTQRALKKETAKELLQLAKLYMEQNELKKTETPIHEYTVREPVDAEGYRVMADLYRRLSQPEKAEAADKLAAALTQ